MALKSEIKVAQVLSWPMWGAKTLHVWCRVVCSRQLLNTCLPIRGTYIVVNLISGLSCLHRIYLTLRSSIPHITSFQSVFFTLKLWMLKILWGQLNCFWYLLSIHYIHRYIHNPIPRFHVHMEVPAGLNQEYVPALHNP